MARFWKTVRVDNIDPRATVQDLKQIFGFNTSDDNSCKVEIQPTESAFNCALLFVPTNKFDETIALNGLEFYDRRLKVTEVQTPPSTMEESMETEIVEQESEIIAMQLDCRLPQWNSVTKKNPAGKVTKSEVIEALVITFTEDPTKRIIPMHGKQIGVFRIQSTDFAQYMNKKLTIRGEELPLTPVHRKPRQRREEGRTFKDNRQSYDPDAKVITIYDANDLHYQNVPHEAFDNYFVELGCRIVRQTQPQRCRENKEMLTINRFIVVRADQEDGQVVDLGHKITIDGHTFKIAYYGMQKYCTLCGRKHGRDCPSKQRFEFLRTLREGKTDKRKIYSDSTMRLVNQLACTTDVACMTGGSIGQICNMIPYEDKRNEIVINAGTNEIRFESLHEFTYTVEKTRGKLEKLKESENVVLVLPSTTTATPEEAAKAKFLKDNLSAIDGIKVLWPTPVECETTFGRVHPTGEGTKMLMEQINLSLNNEIILENCIDDVVSPLKYRLVEPVYKVGCSACDSPGYTNSLCDDCKKAAIDTDIQSLLQMIEEISSEMFPDLRSDNNDVDMPEGNNKRQPEMGHDDSRNAKKVPKVGQ